MRVVCDNCGATYRIPDHKLVREVNKATCRKCGHGIIIRKAGVSSVNPTLAPPQTISPEDATQIASAAEIEARARSGSGRAAASPSGFGPAVGSKGFGSQSPGWSGEENDPETVVSRQDAAAVDPKSADGDETVPWMGGAVPDAGVPPADPDPGLPSFGPGRLPPVAGPAVQSEPPRLPPRPSSTGRPAVQRSRVHDPSADMSVVLAASFISLMAVIFVVTTTDPGIVAMALFAAFAGLLTAIFIIATSSRGREESKPVISIALALMLSAVVTFFFHSQGATTIRVVTAPVPSLSVPARIAAATPPVVRDRAKKEPASAKAEPVAEAKVEPVAEVKDDGVAEVEPDPPPTKPDPQPAAPEPKPEPKAEPAPKAQTSETSSKSSGSSSKSSSPSGSSSKKSSSSSKKSSPSSKKSSSSSKRSSTKRSSSSSKKSSSSSKKSSSSSQPTAKGVPLTVLDTMVKNNRRVKSCFAVYKEKTGALPSGRIPVKIAIEPDGTAYKVWINGGAYSGTTLDKCLSSAIKTITFPPFSGDSQTYNYLFVF